MADKRIKSKALYIVGLPTGISGFRGPDQPGIVTGARLRRDLLQDWSERLRVPVSGARFRMNDGHLPAYQPVGDIQAVTAFLAENPYSEAVFMPDSR